MRRSRARSIAQAALLLFAARADEAQAATMAISLGIPMLAQITGLSDVVFGTLSPTADATSTQNVCAFSNSVTRSYTVTASGSGAGSAFQIASSGKPSIPYSVGWAGTSGSAGTTNLVAGTASAAFAGAALTPGCAIGNATSATLKITILAADLQAMIAGASYTGTLTLLVTPS